MRTKVSPTVPVLVAAVIGPLLVCWLLTLVGDAIDRTNVALILVLVVVGVAATGQRLSGVVAALSATAWFDFFHTEPYLTFTINDPRDIETAVLLILVGLVVTELALWGRRQQGRASRREGYLAGMSSAARAAAVGRAPDDLLDQVAEQIAEVLQADRCRFDRGHGGGHPRLNPDGSVTAGDRRIEVDRVGLPTDDEIELIAEHGGIVVGRFMITSATKIRRPGVEERRLAATLADQAAASVRTIG